MLEKLANKIEKLVNERVEPSIEEIDGKKYVKTYDGYKLLKRRNIIEYKNINTLRGIVKFVQSTIVDNQQNTNLPLYINVEGNAVTVFSKLNEDNERDTILRGNPLLPDIVFDRYISAEEMVIQLKTCFNEAENRDKLIQIISKLKNVQTVELNDDGISQTVTASNGISTSYSVPDLVKLTPKNTYYDIEQVESYYLLRVNKNMGVALFRADGGYWKFEAQKRIVNYLENSLVFELENSLVRIIG